MSRSSTWIRCQPYGVRTGWLISLSLSENAASSNSFTMRPRALKPEVAAGVGRTRILGDLGRDLGELLARNQSLADGLDLRAGPRPVADGVGLRRDLDHLQPHLAGHLGKALLVRLEVGLRLRLRHRVPRELFLLQPFDHRSACACRSRYLLAQRGLGEVLALELLLVRGLAADALLGLMRSPRPPGDRPRRPSRSPAAGAGLALRAAARRSSGRGSDGGACRSAPSRACCRRPGIAGSAGTGRAAPRRRSRARPRR